MAQPKVESVSGDDQELETLGGHLSGDVERELETELDSTLPLC